MYPESAGSTHESHSTFIARAAVREFIRTLHTLHDRVASADPITNPILNSAARK